MAEWLQLMVLTLLLAHHDPDLAICAIITGVLIAVGWSGIGLLMAALHLSY